MTIIRPSSARFYHADGLGSIRHLTDEGGTVTDSYAYSAFGELLNHTGSDLQPYTFVAEPFDPTSGFSYLRARWLDPRVGRFVSTDLFEGFQSEPMSLHKYLYANADPVNNIDPTGLFSGSLSEQTATVTTANILVTIFAAAEFGPCLIARVFAPPTEAGGGTVDACKNDRGEHKMRVHVQADKPKRRLFGDKVIIAADNRAGVGISSFEAALIALFLEARGELSKFESPLLGAIVATGRWGRAVRAAGGIADGGHVNDENFPHPRNGPFHVDVENTGHNLRPNVP